MQFHFNWKITLLVALFLPLTIAAGIWQLSRADEKFRMQAAHQAMTHEAPIALADLSKSQWQDYRNVRIVGEFMAQQFLIDNRIFKGRFGYEVVAPFRFADGRIMMVSRGWTPGNLDRRILPEVPLPAGPVTLTGYLYQPRANLLTDDLPMVGMWPKVMQGALVANMLDELNQPQPISHGYLVRLTGDSPALLTPYWVIVSMPPEKHHGYAFQWFAMALMLVVLLIWGNRNDGNDEDGSVGAVDSTDTDANDGTVKDAAHTAAMDVKGKQP